MILNVLFFKKPISPTINSPSTNLSVIPTLTSRINSLETEISRLADITPIVHSVITPVPVTKKTNRHVSYLPIMGSFSQQAYDWVDVPGSQFYFNSSDYPGLKEVRFEGNLKLVNGNGLAFARLFDNTNKTILIGSVLQLLL